MPMGTRSTLTFFTEDMRLAKRSSLEHNRYDGGVVRELRPLGAALDECYGYEMMPTVRPAKMALFLALIGTLVMGCSRESRQPYTPGLGEIMTLQQMRHSKLWFAGQAGNWKLAAYELKELREGFADVVRFHPTHEGAPVPLEQIVPEMIDGPMDALGATIEAEDSRRFEGAFDDLTNGCNGCHDATNFGFNVVQRPTQNPFSNQAFGPP